MSSLAKYIHFDIIQINSLTSNLRNFMVNVNTADIFLFLPKRKSPDFSSWYFFRPTHMTQSSSLFAQAAIYINILLINIGEQAPEFVHNS